MTARHHHRRTARASAATRLGDGEPALVERLAGDDAGDARHRRRARRRRRATATPPLAMTGTSVAAAAAARPSTSGPASMPSRPMSVMTNAAAAGNRCSASASCTPLALGPPVHGELAVAMVETDGDRHDAADACSTSDGLAHRGRAHHDAGDAGVGERSRIVDACARRRRSAPARRRRRRAAIAATTARLTGEPGPRGVEVDDVDPRRARRRRTTRRPRRDRRRRSSRGRSRPGVRRTTWPPRRSIAG